MKEILPNEVYGRAEEIARWIKREKNVKLANRLNAIRLLMIGKKHSEVGEICGVTIRCITKWIHKWNIAGKEGLKSKSGGSRSKITPEMRVNICKEVQIKTSKGEIVTGCVRKRPQKWPAKQDQERREEFKKEIQILRKKEEISLWFCDETGFEADCSVRQVWCLGNEKPRLPYFGNHIRTSVIGAVKPEDGDFVSLMVPYVDTDIFQYFLDELVLHKDKDKRNIVVIDNAMWHKNIRLNWHGLEKMYLPAYSPDFNPIERLWLAIKNKFFSWFWTDDHDELDNHLENSLKYYHDRKNIVKTTCSMRTFD